MLKTNANDPRSKAGVVAIASLALVALGACGEAQLHSQDFAADETDETDVETAVAAIVSGPAGTVSAQYGDSPAGETISNVIDGDPSTKYLTFHRAVWLQWQGTGAMVVTKYALTSANDAPGRDPKTWTLQGSNNKTKWTTLDRRSAQTFSARLQKKEYSVASSTAYLYYRLNITANNTDAITQLGEWDLTAKGTTAPVVATLFQNCDYGGYAISLAEGSYTTSQLLALGVRNDDLSSLKVAPGYTVTLYENDGFTGASVLKSGATTCLTSSGFNDVTSSIRVAKASSTSDWSHFVYPTVTFTDQAVGLEGSTIFRSAVPDVAQLMRDQCLAVCKELYTDNNDPRVSFSKLNLYLRSDPTGVAAKWGSPPEISIGLSAEYVADFYHRNGDRADLLLQEVRGILSHEGTHGYQWEPKNCGAYDGSSVFWGFIEGEADAVRGELTNWVPARSPTKGGNWNSGYGTGGFFFDWCKHAKKPTFIIELNHAARDLPTFTWEGAFQQILGQSVQSAWDEYQATLPD